MSNPEVIPNEVRGQTVSGSASPMEKGTGDRPRGRWGAPRVGYRVNAAMLWVGLRVLWAGYSLVWLAALAFFVGIPRARRASMRYLDLMHRFSGGAGRRGIARRGWETYHHMLTVGILMMDRAIMLAERRHGFHVDCDGLGYLAEAMRAEEGKAGILLLSAHFGMAEIAAPYMAMMGIDRPTHLVMYQESSDGTERFHARHRRMLEGVSVISTTDPLAAGVKIIAALKKGEVVAMRADRTLAGKAVEVTLLGERVKLPAGPFLAGALSGARVVYVYTCRLGHRQYRCMIGTGSNQGYYGERGGESQEVRVQRAAQDFATHLEGILTSFPYQWSNFYDLWRVQGVAQEAAPQG
jgi:KDO2-lipid IV(A) lauroyltransferase